MKRNRFDVILLLSLLLLFSMSVGFLHGDKQEQPGATQSDKELLNNMPVENIIERLLPLLAAESVEKIVQSLAGISVQKARQVIKAIIESNPVIFSRTDLLNTLFGVAVMYPDHAKADLFNLILDYPSLQVGAPLAAVAVQGSYHAMVPSLLAWSREKTYKNKPLLADLERRSYTHLTRIGDMQAIATLRTYAPLSSILSTDLLWTAINYQKDGGIGQFLIEQGADVGSQRSGMTPLIAAVRSNNAPMVAALVEQGKADLNVIPDLAIGSALQQAVERAYLPLELYLREHGAQE